MRKKSDEPVKSNIQSQDRRVCVGCGAESPETQTSYTLISPRHGWRLSRGKDAEGKAVAEWRCPECWATLKGRR